MHEAHLFSDEVLKADTDKIHEKSAENTKKGVYKGKRMEYYL